MGTCLPQPGLTVPIIAGKSVVGWEKDTSTLKLCTQMCIRHACMHGGTRHTGRKRAASKEKKKKKKKLSDVW